MSEKIFEKFRYFLKNFRKNFDLKNTKSRLFRFVLFVVFVLTQGKIGVLACVCVIEKINNTGTLPRGHCRGQIVEEI